MKVHPNGTPLASIIQSIQNEDKTKKNLISVLSMNLLAPLYVRPIDKRTGEIQSFAAFEWVKDDGILHWDTRKLRLLEYMIASQAQVICVQELQLERQVSESSSSTDPLPLVLPDWIQPNVDKYGYTAILPPQDSLDQIAKRNLRVLGSDSAVSNAISVKKDLWKVLEEPEVKEDSTPAKKKNKKTKEGVQRTSSGANSNTLVSVCLESADKDSQVDPVVISCVHLDATDERKRILGLSKCLERSRSLLDQQTKQDGSTVIRPLRAIIAGDMNAEFVPGSCMVATLRDIQQKKKQQRQSEPQSMDTSSDADEALAEVAACTEALRLTSVEPPTKEQIEDWRHLRQEAYDLVQDQCVSLDRIPTGPTRCAYEHTADSNVTAAETERAMETWKLDHMLYTCSDDGGEDDDKDNTGGVRPLAYWATLEADPISCRTGLPNATCPSDHLPIAAVFELPSGQVTTKENETLVPFLKTVQELEKKFQQTVEQAKADMKLKEQELKQKELEKQNEAASKDETTEEDNSKKEKKKKKCNQKRGAPSAEMMELKREFRSRLKALQMNQAQEREELLRTMGNREKLLLQAHYGIPWRQWLEQGVP